MKAQLPINGANHYEGRSIPSLKWQLKKKSIQGNVLET